MALGGFFTKLEGRADPVHREADRAGSPRRSSSARSTMTALEELEELLLGADLGPAAATDIVENFRRSRFGRSVTDAEIKDALAEEIAAILEPVAKPLVLDRSPQAARGAGGGRERHGEDHHHRQARPAIPRGQGLRPILVAGDTFRAAAVEQLQVWGGPDRRPGDIAGAPNADAAGLAFDALTRARAEGADVLLIDTAGRLHNKSALMEELSKIIRVIRKQDAVGAALGAAGAGCHHRPQRAGAGAGVQGDGGGDGAGGDQAGWQRPGRHRRGAGGGLRLARPCRGRGGAGGRSAAVYGDRFRAGAGRRVAGMPIRFVEANGLRFEVEETGEGSHLALCLHGFPEHLVSWRNQAPVLAEMGVSGLGGEPARLRREQPAGGSCRLCAGQSDGGCGGADRRFGGGAGDADRA